MGSFFCLEGHAIPVPFRSTTGCRHSPSSPVAGDGTRKNHRTRLRSFFHLAIRTGRQMQLSRQATAITRLVKKIRNKKFLRRNGLPILSATGGTRISTGQKGSPTRSTHRALTKGIRKAGSLRHQSIEGRSLGMWIPKGSQGVESLLIGAKPEDIRSGLHTVGRRALIKFWQESLQATFKKA